MAGLRCIHRQIEADPRSAITAAHVRIPIRLIADIGGHIHDERQIIRRLGIALCREQRAVLGIALIGHGIVCNGRDRVLAVSIRTIGGILALGDADLQILGQQDLLAFAVFRILILEGVDGVQSILQHQIALIDHLQVHDLGMSRLPQGVFGEKRSVLRINILFAVPILEPDLQVTGLDLVDAGAGGIGEPRERRPDEHRCAHQDRQCTGQQCPLGGSAVCHGFFLP